MDRKQAMVWCLAFIGVFLGTTVFINSHAEPLASSVEETEEEAADSDVSQPVSSNRYLRVPVGNIMLEPPEDASTKRTPVLFPHSGHFVYTCQTCHHKWIGDDQLKGCASQNCHDAVEKPERPGRKKPDPDYDIAHFRKAYHQQCITCHKAVKQRNLQIELSMKTIEGKLTRIPPTSCLKCHPEE